MQIYQVGGVGPTVNGRNGEGDRYFTDGEITVGVIRPQAMVEGGPPDRKPSLPAIELKNSIWSASEVAWADSPIEKRLPSRDQRGDHVVRD
jgi:hypothetical protein